MTKVYIAETTTITALGDGIDALYEGLIQGECGLSRVTRFNTNRYVSPWAGMIPDLELKDPESKNLDSLIFALADRLIQNLGPVAPDTCLITASTKAGIDLLAPSQKKMDFPSKGLLVSSLPRYISQRLGLARPGFNISSACASSTIALARGAAMIQTGRENAVLICGMDLVSEFVFSGFSALQAMSPSPAAPFDINRKGLTLGEGAGAVLLMNKEKIQSLKNSGRRKPLAEILGWGVANDASYLTAPARDGAGLKQAIESACQKADISIEKIQAVNTHGTGTLFNDQMELTVLRDLFDPDKIMANSIKGAIGHTLGAAGAIETALCVKLLEKRILPGTAGFIEPDFLARGIIDSHARPLAGGLILTINSGFGGTNAALIIQEVLE